VVLDEIVWVRRLAATGSARAMREAARLSLSEVAVEIGVHPSTVMRWERGERQPTAEHAGKWAALLRELAA
jgi:transcriptional regulator with XRE-family HTH domain